MNLKFDLQNYLNSLFASVGNEAIFWSLQECSNYCKNDYHLLMWAICWHYKPAYFVKKICIVLESSVYWSDPSVEDDYDSNSFPWSLMIWLLSIDCNFYCSQRRQSREFVSFCFQNLIDSRVNLKEARDLFETSKSSLDFTY